MSVTDLKTGDLDLDLQGQLALKLSVIPCECNNI